MVVRTPSLVYIYLSIVSRNTRMRIRFFSSLSLSLNSYYTTNATLKYSQRNSLFSLCPLKSLVQCYIQVNLKKNHDMGVIFLFYILFFS